MTVESCVRCGSLFRKTVKDICSTCVIKAEEEYKALRIYLKRHKVTDLHEVSKATAIELEMIHQLLQEGRVSLSTGSTATYPCKACDSGIQVGGICTDCVDELNDLHQSLHTVSSAVPAMPKIAEKPKRPAFHTRA